MIILSGRAEPAQLKAHLANVLPPQPNHQGTVDFRNFIVFFGLRPWHIEIRHRVKQISTINLFGFEILKLKIRRLKLWKPTVYCDSTSKPTSQTSISQKPAV